MEGSPQGTHTLEPTPTSVSALPALAPGAVWSSDLPGHWPRDLLEAYARDPGPYTLDNAEALLDNEPLELYNGWLVWQEMTDFPERRIVWDVDALRQMIWVYDATAPDQPRRYGSADIIDCEPLLPGWRRRVADIFAAQVSAEVVAGEVAQAWREEGATLMLRQVLPMLLRARYGTALPADLSERLEACDLAQLQTLQTATETCATLQDWLARLP